MTKPTSQVLSLLLTTLLIPTALTAQGSAPVRLVAAGGPTLNDLEVGGMIWVAAAGVEFTPTSAPLVLDSSIRYLTYTAAGREHHLLPELSAQWELRLGSIRPFVGGGVGLKWRIRPGDTDRSRPTHVALGARSDLASSVGIRAEARLRSGEPLGDFTLGLSWQLGSR